MIDVEEGRKGINLFLIVVALCGLSVVAGGCGLIMYTVYHFLALFNG